VCCGATARHQASVAAVRRRHRNSPSRVASTTCRSVARWWQEAGGFDERYFPAYYEDLDLCLTLQQLGWNVTYEPTSVVHHAEGGSAPLHFRDFLSRRNQALFVTKWAPILRGYEDPPAREADRAGAVRHALQRAAERPVAARPDATVQVREPTPQFVEAIDDIEALALSVRHLSAAVVVDDEYIGLLRREAAARGLRDAVKDRLRPAVALMKQQLRGSSHSRARRRRSP
jgi:hypothetical protein